MRSACLPRPIPRRLQLGRLTLTTTTKGDAGGCFALVYAHALVHRQCTSNVNSSEMPGCVIVHFLPAAVTPVPELVDWGRLFRAHAVQKPADSAVNVRKRRSHRRSQVSNTQRHRLHQHPWVIRGNRIHCTVVMTKGFSDAQKSSPCDGEKERQRRGRDPNRKQDAKQVCLSW